MSPRAPSEPPNVGSYTPPRSHTFRPPHSSYNRAVDAVDRYGKALLTTFALCALLGGVAAASGWHLASPDDGVLGAQQAIVDSTRAVRESIGAIERQVMANSTTIREQADDINLLIYLACVQARRTDPSLQLPKCNGRKP